VILLLPLGFGILVFILNRPEAEKEINFDLNASQEYNLQVLTAFVSQNKSQGADPAKLKESLIEHGWDHVLVELAIRKVFADV
jgi:hypothetical protein